MGFIFPFQSEVAIFLSPSCGVGSVCVVIVPPAELMPSFLTLGFTTTSRTEQHNIYIYIAGITASFLSLVSLQLDERIHH